MAELQLDDFARYYTEKLWSLVPSIYRLDDGLAETPGVLRAFVELVAERLAELRRSQDRLWDDQFIDACDEWAVPYIGDLLATRLVSALDPRGRRVDVAKTIYYRRRKGTPRVLEELVDDIAGWSGKLVEEFRRLNRTRYRLDPPVAALAGHVTGTYPGGWADLRSVRGAELAGSPFDEFFYTPDVRRARGRSGRYNIPKFTLHLYRLQAWPLVDVTPHARVGGTTFTIDPSGRDMTLFGPHRSVADYDEWHSALPWELPERIACRLLGDAEYVVSEDAIAQLRNAFGMSAAAAAQLRTFAGERVGSEHRLFELVATLPNHAEIMGLRNQLLALTLVDDCGKAALMWRSGTAPGAIAIKQAGIPVPIEHTGAADLRTWTAPPHDAFVLIDPVRGRLLFSAAPAQPLTVDAHYGWTGAIGAGTDDRSARLSAPVTRHIAGGGAAAANKFAAAAVTQIDDSATYGPLADPPAIAALTVQAADRQRPYAVLGGDWTFSGDPNLAAALVFDGLWIGASAAARIVLAGRFASVTIRRCTLDPGGTDADGAAIRPVAIAVTGNVASLTIEGSITGAIALSGGAVEMLTITDSIVQVGDETTIALALPQTNAQLLRTTLLGGAQFDRLSASEALCTGVLTVTDTQAGCFRYSAAAPGSRLPRPYRSVVLDDTRSLFIARAFGDPGYARLSEAAPATIARGGEDTCEIGAFSSLREQVRFANLRVKVDEYVPFGLVPAYFFEE